ncbi:MAG: hypothetical protein WC521_08925 [Bdellovibrionales bacterium]|jgi:hypothetical protein
MSIFSRNGNRLRIDYHIVAHGIYSRLHHYSNGAAHSRAAADLLSELAVEEASLVADAAIAAGHSIEKAIYVESFLSGPVRYKILGKHLDQKLNELYDKYSGKGGWFVSHDNERYFDGGRLIPLYPSIRKAEPANFGPAPTFSVKFTPFNF